MNFFNDDKKEYVIKNMFPKRPWFNYSRNEKYISSFSQFGFGISRYRDKAGNLRSILNDSDNRIIFMPSRSLLTSFMWNHYFKWISKQDKTKHFLFLKSFLT